GDVDVPSIVGGDAPRELDLSSCRAGVAPLGEEGAVRRELLDPVVPGVGHVHVSCGVRGDCGGTLELRVARAESSPAHHGALTVRGESLDARGLEVRDIDISPG